MTDAESLRVQVLQTAVDLTRGDRNKTYGDPYEKHRQIADIFNAITGRDLTAREAALFHVATKLARLSKAPLHHDSYVDAAAYIGIARECAEAEK